MIRFIIDENLETIKNQLIYIPDECYFSMSLFKNLVGNSFTVNNICLTTDENNRIFFLDGFSPYNWEKANNKTPKYIRGGLKIETDLEPGITYSLNGQNWPEYVNITTGWICIGDPLKTEKAVEFISGCIAVLEGDQLAALWLKPKSLPQELYDHMDKQTHFLRIKS